MRNLKNSFHQIFHIMGSAIFTALLLSGCLDGSGGPSLADQTGETLQVDLTDANVDNALKQQELGGSVGDGPITQATITITDDNGAIVAEAISDDSATYSVQVPSAGTHPLLITAANGLDIVTSRPPDFPLVSVAIDSSVSTANINPYTTLIVKVAERMPGGLTIENLRLSRQIVMDNYSFGLDPSLVPDPLTTPITPENIAAIVKGSEALAETIRRVKASLPGNMNESQIIDAMASDMSDGVLDGRGLGADARVTAATMIVGAQVLIETLSNHLYVDGYDATARMDLAINVAIPQATATTGDVVVTDGQLTQTRRMLSAAEMLAQGSRESIVQLKFLLDTLPAGASSQDVDSIIPEGSSDVLAEPISLIASATNEQLESINGTTGQMDDATGTNGSGTSGSSDDAVGPGDTGNTPPVVVEQQSGPDGLVLVHAEKNNTNIGQGGHQWIIVNPQGFLGTAAMEATPNIGVVNNDDYLTASPRLDYVVEFKRSGTHYLWIRALAPTGGDNSIHVGMDGQKIMTSDRINFPSPGAEWQWSNVTTADRIATINVPDPGLHTINVWMREDGIVFDELLLTTNAGYAPAGANQDGGSVAGDNGTGSTGGGTTPDTTPPSDPLGLTAISLSATQVTLSWYDATDDVGVAGYRVYRDGVQIGTASRTSYVDSGLSAQTAYTYSVSAYDLAGNISGRSTTASVTTDQANQGGGTVVAFPGAEGFGANAVGGRGGAVIEVTNLNDSGPGSLRAAVAANGPRTIVFRTGGTIELNSSMVINNPFITIAGQTAPGDGIILKGSDIMKGPLLSVKTHDVVVRFLRMRRGAGAGPDCCGKPFEIGTSDPERQNSVRDIIFDHNSVSWGVDDNGSAWYPIRNITLQWNIFSEGLCKAGTHHYGPTVCHSKGVISGGGAYNLSVHHNLFAHNTQRNPMIASTGRHDLVNNVIYNWRDFGTEMYRRGIDHKDNIIGNFYKLGPDSPWDYQSNNGRYEILLADYSDKPSTYVYDNIGPHRPTNSMDEWALVGDLSKKLLTNNPGCWANCQAPRTWQSTAPWPSALTPITHHPVMQARDLVLQYAGASLNRDTVDIRIVNDVKNGTGKIINLPSEVGGWPVLDPGTPRVDSDHDGMPDSWEIARGLNPSDGSDRNGFAPSGYTWIEEYINSLVNSVPH